MMRSLFSGVAGIKVHQTRMDVIGNNIANINTIGFKSSRTTFSDMLSQLQSSASAPTDGRGGVNAKQIGLGVNVESIDLVFFDSSPQQTGKNTDLALSGNGLFVLRDGNQSYYTRNGAFMFDESGYYVMPGNGLRVQGWNADSDGNINSNGTATDVVVPVGKTMEATATSAIDYSGNLDKETLTIDKISYVRSSDVTDAQVFERVATGTVDNPTSVNVDGENIIAATITLRDGTTRHVTSGYYEVGKSIPITTLATVYDSLGGRHEVTVLLDKDPYTDDEASSTVAAKETQTGTYKYFDDNGIRRIATATGTTDTDGNAQYTYIDSNGEKQTTTTVSDGIAYDNRWRAYLAPGAGQFGPAALTDGNDNTEYSNLVTSTESDGSTMTATMNATRDTDGSVLSTETSYLYFDNRGQFITNGRSTEGEITFTYADGNGADSNTGVLSFTGMSQYANNTTSFPITNGNTAGILQSLAVDGNGIISGTYTNGLVRAEAQIAVAQFSNSAGLTKVGTTIYQESNNSGAANVKTIADFGLNVISSALEMSNVDLANEFSDMIITQRGFQANSNVTTVSDEMLETLVNMKR